MATTKKDDDAGQPVPDIVADPGLSRDAQHSTYKVNKDIPETQPPAGQHVIQELGHPSEAKD